MLSSNHLPMGHQHLADMPHYLQFNPWILGGYRPPDMTTIQCFKSLYYLHNETVNILTHGLPILYVMFYYAELLALGLAPLFITCS